MVMFGLVLGTLWTLLFFCWFVAVLGLVLLAVGLGLLLKGWGFYGWRLFWYWLLFFQLGWGFVVRLLTGFALFRVLLRLLHLLLPFHSPSPLFRHFPWNKLRLWRQNIPFHANFRLIIFLVLEWSRFSIVQFVFLSIHLDGWLSFCLWNSWEHWSLSAVELGKNLLGQSLVWRLRFLLV